MEIVIKLVEGTSVLGVIFALCITGSLLTSKPEPVWKRQANQDRDLPGYEYTVNQDCYAYTTSEATEFFTFKGETCIVPARSTVDIIRTETDAYGRLWGQIRPGEISIYSEPWICLEGENGERYAESPELEKEGRKEAEAERIAAENIYDPYDPLYYSNDQRLYGPCDLYQFTEAADKFIDVFTKPNGYYSFLPSMRNDHKVRVYAYQRLEDGSLFGQVAEEGWILLESNGIVYAEWIQEDYSENFRI